MWPDLFNLPKRFEALHSFALKQSQEVARLCVVVQNLEKDINDIGTLVSSYNTEIESIADALDDMRKQRDLLQGKLFEVIGIGGTHRDETVPAFTEPDELGRSGPRPVNNRRVPWTKVRQQLEVADARQHGDKLEKYWKNVASQYKSTLEKPNASEKREAVREDGTSHEGLGALDSSIGGQGLRQRDSSQEETELRKSLEE